MDIRIDCELLERQIRLCENCGGYFKNEEVKSMLDGVANLLSTILFAVEEDEYVNFIRAED